LYNVCSEYLVTRHLTSLQKQTDANVYVAKILHYKEQLGIHIVQN